MNWDLILQTARPVIIGMIQSAITSFGTPTKPAAPLPPDDAPAGTVASPDEFIRHLQAFLNVTVHPSPPLVEDGWIGPLTRAAGEQAMQMLRSAGIGR